MNILLLPRLLFDLLAAILFVFGLSYWWLGNTAHELAGTTLFLLLIAHNVFNRRFYGTLARTGRNARGLANIAVTFALALAMVVLLVTSVFIANSLSGVMSAYGGLMMRQLHTLAAYWALIIVGVHLGLRWSMLLGVARTLFGITRPSAIREGALWAIALAVVGHGVWSAFALGLGDKLTMRVSLDWWSFEESVIGFFVHCVAVVGLCMVLTRCALTWVPIIAVRSVAFRSRKIRGNPIHDHGER